LDEAVAEWIGNGQDMSFLYSGARLVQAEEWAESRSGDLTISAQEFLVASLVRRVEEHRLELTRTQALEEEKHRYIEADRKRKRLVQRSKVLTIGLLVLLTIAMIGVSIAIQQKQRLEARRNVKIAEDLANRALAIQEANPILSQLLSMEAMRIARNNGEPRLPTAEGTLRSLLAYAGGMPLAHDRVRMVSISADHQWLAIGKADGNTSLWHFTDKGPKLSAVTPDNLRGLALLAVSSGGRWLLQATQGGTSRLLDLSVDPKDPRHLNVLDGQDWLAGSAPFSPKGRWLAMRTTRNGSPSLVLRNLLELTKAISLDATYPTAFAFSHDEKWFATATADNVIRVWNLATPGAPTLFASSKNNRGAASSLRFLGDKWLLTLVSESAQGSIQAWRLKPTMTEYPLRRDNQRCDGSEQMSAATEDSAVVSWGKNVVCTWVSTGNDVLVETSTDISSGTFAALSPDGAWLATGYLNGEVSFGPLGGEDDEFTSLPNQARPLVWLDFSGDSRWLVTWGGAESPRVWRVNQEGVLSTAADPEVTFYPYPSAKVIIGPKGQRLEIDDANHRATLFDPFGKMITPSVAFSEKVKWPWVFSADGQWLTVGDDEGDIHLWRIRDNKFMLPLVLNHYHVGAISALAFSPNGNWMASGDENGNSLLWNLHDLRHAPKPLTRHHAGNVTALAFSQGGDSIATGGEDGNIYIRKISGGRISSGDAPDVPPSRKDSISALAFGPDGWLAISYEPSDVCLWKVNRKPVLLEGPTLDTSILLFSPGNQWLVGGAGSTYSLWNFSGEKTTTTPVVLKDSTYQDQEALFGATFSPDSSKLISFGELGEVIRWELRNEKLHEIACQAAGRNLTEKEWTTYIPSEHYQENEPCPEFTKASD
jgi:WD40 repeat protein